MTADPIRKRRVADTNKKTDRRRASVTVVLSNRCNNNL